MEKSIIMSLPSLLAFILLFTMINAFQINSDYSYCNSLIIRTQVSPQDLNSTNGMVLQFTHSKNIQDPALFNTTLAWTDFVTYETYEISSLLPATQIGNTYFYTNVSMTSAMNASWVGSGVKQEFHTIMWLYIQPPNTSDPALRTSFGGFGNPFVPTSDVHPFCEMFYTANGTRTSYNPNLFSSTTNNNGSADSSSWSKGQKAGVVIGCILGVLILLFIVIMLLYVCIAPFRHKLRSCGWKTRQALRRRLDKMDDEERTTVPPVISEYEEKQNKMKKVGFSEDVQDHSHASMMHLQSIIDGTTRVSRNEDQIMPDLPSTEEEAPPPSYTEANAKR